MNGSSRSSDRSGHAGGAHALACLLILAALAATTPAAHAQSELLPVDHPATAVLVRLHQYGALPHFPSEHLPVSRGAALRFLDRAVSDTTVPQALRELAAYYRDELAVDVGRAPVRVLIPAGTGTRFVLDHLGSDESFAIVDHRDTSLGMHMALLPVLDGELRAAPADALSSLILQGGVELRGTVLDHVGFSARATNGTVLGDTSLPLRDPRFSHSLKFGLINQGHDVDFGRGHLRLDFDHLSIGIGREAIELGAGGASSLLVGSELPSNYDWLRLRASFGPVDFTHLHAMLLARSSGPISGVAAEIPSKYLAAHLLSVGPFAGIRATIGESIIYSGRPIEFGYLNPLNFLKSEEHYLRDRDNANMYAALSVNPVDGVYLEGEFLLDDLRFELIGDRYWGNKTAWRIGGRLVAVPWTRLDLGIRYTRLEPYVYSHFNPTNAVTHDGVMIPAGGLEPNSDALDLSVDLWLLPRLSVHGSAEVIRHGANVYVDDTLARNVGGNVELSNDSGRDSPEVTFLDGVLEHTLRFGLDAEYEPVRNLYVRLHASTSSTTADGIERPADTQIWIGLRLGAW